MVCYTLRRHLAVTQPPPLLLLLSDGPPLCKSSSICTSECEAAPRSGRGDSLVPLALGSFGHRPVGHFTASLQNWLLILRRMHGLAQHSVLDGTPSIKAERLHDTVDSADHRFRGTREILHNPSTTNNKHHTFRGTLCVTHCSEQLAIPWYVPSLFLVECTQGSTPLLVVMLFAVSACPS